MTDPDSIGSLYGNDTGSMGGGDAADNGNAAIEAVAHPEFCQTPRDNRCGQMPIAIGGPLGFLNIYRCPHCGSESWT